MICVVMVCVCVCCRNLKMLSELSSSVTPPILLINITVEKSVSVETYEHWYDMHGHQLNLAGYNISSCSLEEAMSKVPIDYICIIRVHTICKYFWKYMPVFICLTLLGSGGDGSGLYSLHRGHDSVSCQSLLVSTVLFDAPQPGIVHHVRYHAGDPHPSVRYLLLTEKPQIHLYRYTLPHTLCMFLYFFILLTCSLTIHFA